MALARALYRAALRGANAVEQAEGGLMQIVGPVNSAEWGSYRRLTAQDRDEQREALFPWASADDTVSEPGALTGAELRALASTLSSAVRSRLYVKGGGYWACEQPSGELVEVRHVIDFATVTHALGLADLGPTIANETVEFVLREVPERGTNWCAHDDLREMFLFGWLL